MLTELPGGGTADIFVAVAEDGTRSRLVVLKALRRALEVDAELVRMFRREARLAARIQHPNVVEVFGVVEDRGRPVLVMEFLDGASLRELSLAAARAGVRLPLRGQIETLVAICRGLHFCHELRDEDGLPLGLVHRDVSPHNVFLTVDGRAKLLDFGIAKTLDHGGSTQTGMVKGKLRYMAPEQMVGDPLDRRADIYALGVLLWEAMAGRAMWANVPDTVLMSRTVSGEIPEPDPVVPGCTPGLRDITRRCLSHDPAERYPTCAALADALERELAAMPRSRMTLARLAAKLFEERRKAVQDHFAGKSTQQNVQNSPIDWHVRRIDPLQSLPIETRSRRGFLRAGVIVTLVAAIGTWQAWPLARPESRSSDPGIAVMPCVARSEGDVAAPATASCLHAESAHEGANASTRSARREPTPNE